jgi:hypothetical protein
VVLAGYDAQGAGGERWRAIATWLSLHQDELDVVLDYGVGFVGLTQKSSAIAFCLKDGVRNLVPYDWREIPEP